MAERAAYMRREWHDYEWRNWTKVIHPDWRTRSREWAKRECEIGRPIPAYHP